MDFFQKILSSFKAVSLDETCEVKLMNRIDRKYWFHISLLPELLNNTLPYYDVLEINGERLMEYETTYFDTPDNLMYRFHHNQKLNRYKIRRRRYCSTQNDFLEIKLKNNKRRTVKERMEASEAGRVFTNEEIQFIAGRSPFEGEQLKPTLKNKFRRITLVGKDKYDRCTFDLGLVFSNNSGKIELENMVVVEIKREKSLKASPLLNMLREKRVRQRGLSKYCTGRALLEPNLKQNAFKPRLRYIEKYFTATVTN